MTVQETAQKHRCTLCDQEFKREDHLSRHKLSHGKARFQCNYNGCGMAFHRKDVLDRHEKVHQPDPSRKRRRPRRGADPKPFVKVQLSALDGGHFDRQMTWSSDTGSPWSTSTCVSSQQGKDNFADLPADALAFCSLHFAESCMRRFPFIHRTSLDRGTMIPEKLLAMAVLGGCAIPEYQTATRQFFERAKTLLKRRSGSPLLRCDDDEIAVPQPEVLEEQLSLFQAQVLLIEFTLWSRNKDDENWAKQCAFRLAHEIVPNAVKYVLSLKDMNLAWLGWVHREQCLRALWAYYCTTQKARPFAPLPFSTQNLQSELWLPGSAEAFDAIDEVSWNKILHNENITCSVKTSDFKSPFYNLMSITNTNRSSLQMIQPLGWHILISALFDQYLNALTVPSNYQSQAAYSNGDLSQFTPRASYLECLAVCKQFSWTDPAILFGAYPPRANELQNGLLLNYLEVLVLGGKNENLVPRVDFLAAVSVACSIFCAMIRNGILEVATRACWLTDGASRHFVVEFGRLMVRWAHGLESCNLNDNLEADDRQLFARCCEALQAFNEQFPHIKTKFSCDIRYVEQSLIDAWSIIMGERGWLRGAD